MLRFAIAGGISGYQQLISPYKGFSCAYRVVGKAESCSAYGKRAILRHGTFKGLWMLLDRFEACRAAAQARREERESRWGEVAEELGGELACRAFDGCAPDLPSVDVCGCAF